MPQEFLECNFGKYVKMLWILYNKAGAVVLPSCLALYSFCTNLLYSLVMWLIVSSLIIIISSGSS